MTTQTGDSDLTGREQSARSLPAWCAFALSLIGLAVSAYLTYEHFTGSTTLACSDTGTVNCLKVTTSQWSVILGVPVAVAGLAFYAAMTLLCLPISAVTPLHLIRIAFCAIGMLMVLWLIYVELFKVGAICLWCTTIHVTTFLLLGTVIWWREQALNAA